MDYYYEILYKNQIISNLSFRDLNNYDLQDIDMLIKHYFIYKDNKKIKNNIILFNSDMPQIKALDYITNYIKSDKMYGINAINTDDIILLLRFENQYTSSNYYI